MTLASVPSSHQRDVCVLCADVVDSTGLAHRLSLTQYTALMTEAIQLLLLACESRGGETLTPQGDAVIALWDRGHAVYALETAWELHGRLAALHAALDLDVSLRLRVGLASGEVVHSVVGGYATAYGLPINLARRLSDVGREGMTLVCEETWKREPAVPFCELRTVAVQGFALLRGAYLAAAPSLRNMKIS